MKVTLGGDRLGSGKKMKVNLHNFERSSHNLSRIWRSSMAPGTLVPLITEIGLPGDTFDIDPTILIRTLPTTGPLYGSFKFQMDFFLCPIRLYNKQLHNNKLGIGRNIEKVIFPTMTIQGPYQHQRIQEDGLDVNMEQINQSSLLAYTGTRGVGIPTLSSTTSVKRDINAMPILAYWDIFKNYYANKQEENAYFIGGNVYREDPGTINTIADTINQGEPTYWLYNSTDNAWTVQTSRLTPAAALGWYINIDGVDLKAEEIRWGYRQTAGGTTSWQATINNESSWFRDRNSTIPGRISLLITGTPPASALIVIGYAPPEFRPLKAEIELIPFKLTNIDDIREKILEQQNTTPFNIPQTTSTSWMPFTACNTPITGSTAPAGLTTAWLPMAGLAVKTYNSDRFNNWLSTDWIDGANGVSQMSAVSTASGSFTMDTLNLAQKVYDMLNRIAVSGGSYYDWQEAVYGENARRQAETPMYMGGMSDEIMFNEVVSTAETEESPLGTLGGRGNASKNGKTIRIKVEEPSYIMGIVSITPRVDYSQGNKWFTRLKNMNDLHKPSLDGIGFQELPTDEMAAFDTIVSTTGVQTIRSAGKQPAWVHYMTAVNETYGTFAEPNNTMFMTLNRRYTYDTDERKIKDLTTYIDPTKFNHVFAQTDITAQNFWSQVALDITARRKMSAKQIPNL